MTIGNAIELGKSVLPMCLIPHVSFQSCNTSLPRNGDLLENPEKGNDSRLEKCTLHGQEIKKPNPFNLVKMTGNFSPIFNHQK